MTKSPAPGAGGASGVRFALRDATAAAHQRVDDAFSILDVADPAGYRAFLAAHAAAFLPCEQALDAAGAASLLPDWPQRRRADALLADLAQLGVAPAPAIAPPALSGPAAMFGALYVLEGSRLGGALLARQLTSNPDPACRSANLYLDHGDRRHLWPSFVAMLDASPEVQHDLPAVLAAATSTFAVFEQAAMAASAAFPIAGAA